MLKSIDKDELKDWANIDWVAQQRANLPSAHEGFQMGGTSRIFDWRVGCVPCHNLMFKWLTEWIEAGYTIFPTRSFTTDECTLFGLTCDMPGLVKRPAASEVVPPALLPGGYEDVYGLWE